MIHRVVNIYYTTFILKNSFTNLILLIFMIKLFKNKVHFTFIIFNYFITVTEQSFFTKLFNKN